MNVKICEDYEQFVQDMWMGGNSSIEFAAIGFGGECGEVLNEIKKELRDLKVSRREFIRDELGDSLYYLVRLAALYDYDLKDIMNANVKKLKARQLETGIPSKVKA